MPSGIQSIASWQDWQVITVILSITAFAGASIVYMLSKILNSKEIEHNAKKELIESLANVVAAILIISVLLFLEPELNKFIISSAQNLNLINPNIIPTLTNARPGEIAAAISLRLSKCITDFVPLAYFLFSFTSYGYQIKSVVIDTTVGPDADMFITISENLFNFILQVTVILFIWIKFLLFGSFVGPSLIAIGFPLRAFPPTRGAGAYLVAMGLGIYFIMPFAYMVGLTIFYNGFFACKPVLSSNYQYVNSANSNTFHMIASSLIYVIANIGKFITNITTASAELVKNLCIIPFFALAFTLTFVNIGSTFLGARLSEIGRGLIKLI
ncbi:MAG: hypothetical protein QXI89_02250 [Candidatus Anstonellales archaeon]